MDKTKPNRAAVIASAAKDHGGMFVFATLDSNLIQSKDASSVIAKFKYHEHSCADCGSSFAAPVVAGLQYHCVSCGSGKVEASAKEVKPVIASDDSLSLVDCSSCGTHNVTHKSVVASVNQLNCTTCGHTMNFKATAGSDEDLDDMDTVDIEGDEDATDETAANDGQDIPSSPDGVNTNEIPSDQPLDMDPAVVPGVSQGFDQGTDPSEAAPATIDLLSEFDANKDAQLAPEGTQLSFVYVGGKMGIAAGTTILATLSAEEAGEHAEMLHTQAFQTAVAHSIRTLGVKEAARTYGFKPATVTVNIDKIALERASVKAEAAATAVTATIEDVAADFGQSVDIAAAGFAANFWRNKHDPVKAALITEFTNLGVKAASKVVDRIFASHGVQQMREVLVIARELAEKPVEARNGLAQAIDLGKYLPTSVKATAEDESDLEELDDGDIQYDDSEEAGVIASVAIPAQTPAAVTASTGRSNYKTPELRSILGGLSFN